MNVTLTRPTLTAVAAEYYPRFDQRRPYVGVPTFESPLARAHEAAAAFDLAELAPELLAKVASLLNKLDFIAMETALGVNFGYVMHADRGLDFCLLVEDPRAALRLLRIGGLSRDDALRAAHFILTHPSDAAVSTAGEIADEQVAAWMRNDDLEVFRDACLAGRSDTVARILKMDEIYAVKYLPDSMSSSYTNKLKGAVGGAFIEMFLRGRTETPVFQMLLRDGRFHLGLQSYRALTEVVKSRLGPLGKLAMVDYVLAHSPAAADATTLADWQCPLDHPFRTAFADGSLASLGVVLRLLDLGYKPQDNDSGVETRIRKFGSACRVAMFLTKFLTNAIRRCRIDTVYRLSAAPVSIGGYEIWIVLPSTAHQLSEIKAWARDDPSRRYVRYTPPANALVQMFTKWAKRDSGRNARAAKIVDVVGYDAVAHAPEAEGAVLRDGKIPDYYYYSKGKEATDEDDPRDRPILDIAVEHADVRSLCVILERAASAGALSPGLYPAALKRKKSRVNEAFVLLHSFGCDPEGAGEPMLRAALFTARGGLRISPDWNIVEAVLQLPGLPRGNQAPLHEALAQFAGYSTGTNRVAQILALPGYDLAGAGDAPLRAALENERHFAAIRLVGDPRVDLGCGGSRLTAFAARRGDLGLLNKALAAGCPPHGRGDFDPFFHAVVLALDHPDSAADIFLRLVAAGATPSLVALDKIYEHRGFASIPKSPFAQFLFAVVRARALPVAEARQLRRAALNSGQAALPEAIAEGYGL